MAILLSNIEYIFARANSLGYQIEEIDSSKKVYAIYKNPLRKRYIFGQSLGINSSSSIKICKYKDLTKKILSQANIRVPKGVVVGNSDHLKIVIRKNSLKFPLVIKPVAEALGKGVIAKIETKRELFVQYKNISSKYSQIIIEEYFAGVDHRFFVLSDKVIAVCKRLKPFVVGDGKKTINMLLYELNEKRFRKVRVDGEVERNLAKKELKTDSVLEKGRKVILRQNSNYSTGGITKDVTNSIDDKYTLMARKCADILGLKLCGIDMLISRKCEYMITEVNSLPSFDLHIVPDLGSSKRVDYAVFSNLFK